MCDGVEKLKRSMIEVF